MKGITFNIFFMSKEEQKAIEMELPNGGEITLKETKPVTFYNIDFTHPNDEFTSVISVSGVDFVANEPIDVVDMRIRDARMYVFN